MTPRMFDQLKAYVCFGPNDAENVRALAKTALPLFSAVVDRFYSVLLDSPGARAVLTDGKPQIERLKRTLKEWLESLFGGSYDGSYFRARAKIGNTHVRVGLPQHFMPLAMEVVRGELFRGLAASQKSGLEPKLDSLQKLLTLDLAIMLDSYKEAYSRQVRETEQRAVEAKLARAEHLAEIGQLAASLAHEIKNPLAGISGAIQVIGESFAEDDPYKSIVNAILAQVSRLDATVKDLLQYARPNPPMRKHVDVGWLVRRLVGIMSEEPSLRGVDVRIDDVDGSAEADEGQLEQLLMNLILNAAHASSEGAVIEISTGGDTNRLSLIIKDSGAGMSEDVKERAMEPFYTTKAKGTGLGLAICRRIAEAHGGSISIDSRVGVGTTVVVELPRALSVAKGKKS